MISILFRKIIMFSLAQSLIRKFEAVQSCSFVNMKRFAHDDGFHVRDWI